jgi:hypothetical protein
LDIIIILCLSVLCLYLIQYQKRMKQTFKRTQAEMAVTMEQTENRYRQNLENEINNIKQSHKEEMNKARNYIKSLEKLCRNPGEVITHKILMNLREEFIQQGKIHPEEMIIMANVFVPFTENNVIKTRQIDHLVLLPTDIYIIETKYWRGKVLHGLTKEKAGEFSFILDTLFPKHQNNTEHTIVFIKDNTEKTEEQSGFMKIVSYENPSTQVIKTALKLKDFLITFNKKFNYVEPILYYGYDSDDFNEVIILSEKDKPRVFKSEKDLVDYFENELKRKKKFSVNDLEEIKQIMEQVNYIS